MKKIKLVLMFLLIFATMPVSSAIAYSGDDIFPLMVKDTVESTSSSTSLSGTQKIVYTTSSSYEATHFTIISSSGGYDSPSTSANSALVYAYDTNDNKFPIGLINAQGTLSKDISIPNFKKIEIVGQYAASQRIGIGSIAVFALDTTPTPEPTTTPVVTPEPTATPEIPSGDRALLTITLTTGVDKEFDLSISEVNNFLNWYDTASGATKYGINKHDNNKGPFSKRTDYVIHDKILSFEVSEYTTK
jgi:hypothetical protein